jgi:hypothetical protein
LNSTFVAALLRARINDKSKIGKTTCKKGSLPICITKVQPNCNNSIIKVRGRKSLVDVEKGQKKVEIERGQTAGLKKNRTVDDFFLQDYKKDGRKRLRKEKNYSKKLLTGPSRLVLGGDETLKLHARH